MLKGVRIFVMSVYSFSCRECNANSELENDDISLTILTLDILEKM